MDAAINAVMRETDEQQPITERPAHERNHNQERYMKGITIKSGNKSSPAGL